MFRTERGGETYTWTSSIRGCANLPGEIVVWGEITALGNTIRYDALIAGAGPTGMLTALLARERGYGVLVVETGGAVFDRPQLARFASDTQRLHRSVGAGDAFPPYDDRRGPSATVTAIRDAVTSLRSAGERSGLPVRLNASFDRIEDTSTGVRARVTGAHGFENVEAPLLFDASGGSLFRGHERLGLRHTDGESFAIGLEWAPGTARPVVSADADDVLRVPVEASGATGKFVGVHDVARGAFGVVELTQAPSAAQTHEIIEQVQRSLGIDEPPTLHTEFATSNRIAPTAWDGGVALLGDSVTKIRPRSGLGLNLGAHDAVDAVRLLDDLARIDPTKSGQGYAAMLREQAFGRYSTSVMRRHKDALASDQARNPFDVQAARRS